ncbi:MAG TPA: tRNA 2-selenouridine(34) synthase MnmH [Phaeodactylibacter sp.]|nr:tRNA 2-selenouridine(34) synthase MnmH [Phaeodactylibacter sp.]
MPKYILPEQALQQLPEVLLLDVRTPAEYAESHIPGARNLPLFDNEERAEIGTLYKQVDPRTALLKGLELVGPKMRQLVEQTDEWAADGRVMVHCWRGGQRSGSVAWLLEMSGYEVQVVKGGYKAYRRFVQERLWGVELPLLVVGGPTGAGKTEVLHELAKRGEQVVDLEGLAHHKGSAFGALGEASQPSVAAFENRLYKQLSGLDLHRRIWIEDESRMIGMVALPEGLFKQMQQAPVYLLEVSEEARLDRLVKVYAGHDKEALAIAFQRIRKRLGGLRFRQAMQALEQGNYREAARLALAYYDKAYRHHSEQKRPGQEKIVLPMPSDSPSEIAEALIKHANQRP